MALLTGRRRAYSRSGAPYGMAFGSGFPPGYGFTAGGVPMRTPNYGGLDATQQALLAQLIAQVQSNQNTIQAMRAAMQQAQAAGIPPGAVVSAVARGGGIGQGQPQGQQGQGQPRPQPGIGQPPPSPGQVTPQAAGGPAGGVGGRPTPGAGGPTTLVSRGALPFRPDSQLQLGGAVRGAPGYERAFAGATIVSHTPDGMLVRMGDGSLAMAPYGSTIGAPTEPGLGNVLTSGPTDSSGAQIVDNTQQPRDVLTTTAGPTVENRPADLSGGLTQQPSSYPSAVPQPVYMTAPWGTQYQVDPTTGSVLDPGFYSALSSYNKQQQAYSTTQTPTEAGSTSQLTAGYTEPAPAPTVGGTATPYSSFDPGYVDYTQPAPTPDYSAPPPQIDYSAFSQ